MFSRLLPLPQPWPWRRFAGEFHGDVRDGRCQLRGLAPDVEVPVYFCCGRRDYNVPSELVVEFGERLRAPHKEIVWFEHSAHLPNFEEPQKFCDFCISLLGAG